MYTGSWCVCVEAREGLGLDTCEAALSPPIMHRVNLLFLCSLVVLPAVHRRRLNTAWFFFYFSINATLNTFFFFL